MLRNNIMMRVITVTVQRGNLLQAVTDRNSSESVCCLHVLTENKYIHKLETMTKEIHQKLAKLEMNTGNTVNIQNGSVQNAEYKLFCDVNAKT
jgi:hypothetical protein